MHIHPEKKSNLEIKIKEKYKKVNTHKEKKESNVHSFL